MSRYADECARIKATYAPVGHVHAFRRIAPSTWACRVEECKLIKVVGTHTEEAPR